MWVGTILALLIMASPMLLMTAATICGVMAYLKFWPWKYAYWILALMTVDVLLILFGL